MGEGRERVRSVRAGASALSDLPAAFQRVADETAPSRAATFKTIVEGNVRELNPMVLEESYSIAREALINALAHSGGLHVEVEIMYDPRQFRLRVRDDGRGVDPRILENGGRPGHWGMQGNAGTHTGDGRATGAMEPSRDWNRSGIVGSGGDCLQIGPHANEDILAWQGFRQWTVTNHDRHQRDSNS
jgi:hypothetical protein